MSGVRILITGASGLLGAYLARAATSRRLDPSLVGLTLVPEDDPRWLRCDLTDPDSVARLWERVAPQLVVHAAALTNVDLCERDPALADAVNRQTTELLARHAVTSGARLVYVSTDSVFDGRRGGYAETDEPAPLNVYARTKLEAEREAAAADDHLIVRTNFFGRSARGHGLAEWILRQLQDGNEIVGFSDVVFSPLYCGDFAELLLELTLGDTRGIVHLGAADAISKLEFAQLVARAAGVEDPKIRPGRLTEVGLAAPRPLDTSLDSSAAARQFDGLPTVEEGVRRMTAESPAVSADRRRRP